MSKAVGIDLGAESLRGAVMENVKGKLQLVSAGSVPLGELGLMEDLFYECQRSNISIYRFF